MPLALAVGMPPLPLGMLFLQQPAAPLALCLRVQPRCTDCAARETATATDRSRATCRAAECTDANKAKKTEDISGRTAVYTVDFPMDACSQDFCIHIKDGQIQSDDQSGPDSCKPGKGRNDNPACQSCPVSFTVRVQA